MDSTPTSERVVQKRLEKLLAELKIGRPEFLSQLLELYRPYLLATARVRLVDSLKAKAGPSDLVQETIIAAHCAWQNLATKPDSEDEFRKWLRNILLERVKALHRRYYRVKGRSLHRERSFDCGSSQNVIDNIAASLDESPSARFNRELIAEHLEVALQQLPAAYRQVIEWRTRDGWPFAKIGGRIDRSPDAARMLWRRAILQLKKELVALDVGR